VLKRAEEEIEFILKYNIRALFYTDSEYPKRLLNCEDGPLMLYYKGSALLNNQRVLAVVGTRRATNYGRSRCEEIVSGLKDKDVTIISGLAYGIDSCAHRSALSSGLETIAVVAHGLDMIYPSQNRKLAEKMLDNGGLLTEFRSGSKPDRENFPKRNRIVAGMSDAVLVIVNIHSRLPAGETPLTVTPGGRIEEIIEHGVDTVAQAEHIFHGIPFDEFHNYTS
jgi:DNA processing protein